MPGPNTDRWIAGGVAIIIVLGVWGFLALTDFSFFKEKSTSSTPATTASPASSSRSEFVDLSNEPYDKIFHFDVGSTPVKFLVPATGCLDLGSGAGLTILENTPSHLLVKSDSSTIITVPTKRVPPPCGGN